MKYQVQQVLAESHVAAVAIALLLLWSVDSAFRALWPLVYRILSYLVTAIAILDIPYISPGVSFQDRLTLITTCTYMCAAATQLAAAWLISRWIYGTGPLGILMTYYSWLDEEGTCSRS